MNLETRIKLATAESLAMHSIEPFSSLWLYELDSSHDDTPVVAAVNAMYASDGWKAPRVEISRDLLGLVVTWAKDEARAFFELTPCGGSISVLMSTVSSESEESFQYVAKRLGFASDNHHDPHIRAALWPVYQAHLIAETERLVELGI